VFLLQALAYIVKSKECVAKASGLLTQEKLPKCDAHLSGQRDSCICDSTHVEMQSEIFHWQRVLKQKNPISEK